MNPIHSGIISTLRSLHETEGHTCYPLFLLVENVARDAKSQASAVLKEVKELRNQGVIATGTQPFPMIALKDVMHHERFISDTLKLHYQQSMSSTVTFKHLSLQTKESITTSIHSYENDAACRITDSMRYAVYAAFLDTMPLVLLTRMCYGKNDMTQTLSAVCKKQQQSTLFLWYTSPPVVNQDNSQKIMSMHIKDFLEMHSWKQFKHSDPDSLLMVVLTDANHVNSTILTRCLVSLPSNIRLILIGDPNTSQGIVCEIYDLPCVKSIFIYPPEANIDTVKGRLMHDLLQKSNPLPWLQASSDAHVALHDTEDMCLHTINQLIKTCESSSSSTNSQHSDPAKENNIVIIGFTDEDVHKAIKEATSKLLPSNLSVIVCGSQHVSCETMYKCIEGIHDFWQVFFVSVQSTFNLLFSDEFSFQTNKKFSCLRKLILSSHLTPDEILV